MSKIIIMEILADFYGRILNTLKPIYCYEAYSMSMFKSFYNCTKHYNIKSSQVKYRFFFQFD